MPAPRRSIALAFDGVLDDCGGYSSTTVEGSEEHLALQSQESSSGDSPTEPSDPCLLPGVSTRRVRVAVPPSQDAPPPGIRGARRLPSLKLVSTPTSHASPVHKCALTPTTPDPAREGGSATCAPQSAEDAADKGSEAAAFSLPGVCTRRVRVSLPPFEESSPPAHDGPHGARRFASLKLATPSSCASAHHKYIMTPTTPDPARAGFLLIDEDVDVVFFDFDGTLTTTPGHDALQRWEKKADLRARAPLLAPRLRGLRDAGLTVGIISKSTEQTIRDALQYSGLDILFNGPVVGKAVGFEGKAGFIADLFDAGKIQLGPEGLQRVLLIDDDVRELQRAKERGIQTYAAPQTGGLQEEDFDEIFCCLGLPSPRWAPPVGRGFGRFGDGAGDDDDDGAGGSGSSAAASGGSSPPSGVETRAEWEEP